MKLGTLTVEQLQEAIRIRRKLERIEQERESLIRQLNSLGTGETTETPPMETPARSSAPSTGSKPGRRRGYKMSAETRAKMRAAAKLRWKARKANQTAAAE